MHTAAELKKQEKDHLKERWGIKEEMEQVESRLHRGFIAVNNCLQNKEQ